MKRGDRIFNPFGPDNGLVSHFENARAPELEQSAGGSKSK